MYNYCISSSSINSYQDVIWGYRLLLSVQEEIMTNKGTTYGERTGWAQLASKSLLSLQTDDQG